MHRIVALLATLAMAVVAAVALAFPAAAASPTPTPTPTPGPTTVVVVPPTTTPPPGLGVNATVCAALTVEGVKLLGTEPTVSALLNATLGIGNGATPAQIAEARRVLGCGAAPADQSPSAVRVSVCALVTVNGIGGLLDQLDVTGIIAGIVNAARPNVNQIVDTARNALCSADGDDTTVTVDPDDDDPTPTAKPVKRPKPIGAPETGGR